MGVLVFRMRVTMKARNRVYQINVYKFGYSAC